MPRYNKGRLAAEVLAMYKDRNLWTEATAKLEFKSGKEGLPNSLWESYSAFANTNGGYIIIGVRNNGEVEGLDGKADQYRDQFVNILSTGNKCNYAAGAEGGNIAIVELDHHEVLAIRVNEAAAGEKPVYLDGKLQKSYVRSLEGDRRCTERELACMIRDHEVVNSHYTADADILPHTGLDDLDTETIRQYQEDLLRARANHAWGELDSEGMLTKLGAYRMDRKTGQKGLTLAGLLMFGRTETIMELHPRYRLDFFELDGSEQFNIQQRWADRITVDGTWQANLYQFYKRVWPRLTAELKRPFRLGADMKRHDDSTAHEAVREALANAIIHADYLLDGGIQIYKRPSGLTLSNAGRLLLSKHEIFEGGNSLCRNRNLQKMFKLAGFVEEAGSGVDKITRGWVEQYLCLPELEEDTVGMRVIWTLPYVSMLSKSGMAAQRAYIGAEKYRSLSVLEKVILLLFPGKQYISNADIRHYLPQLHPADVGHILSKLRDAGYLESKGRSNAMKYTLSAPLAAFMQSAQSAESAENNIESSVLNGESSVLNGSSSVLNGGSPVLNGDASKTLNECCSVINSENPALGGSSVLNGGSSVLNSENPDKMADNEEGVCDARILAQKLGLPAELQEELQFYREKQRHTRWETDTIVLKLCKGRWLTSPQLSILLDRTPKVLRRDCIAALVRHGQLEYKEEKLTHQNQAYRTVE